MVTIKINKTKEEVHKSWQNWKKENWGLYKSLMQICAFCGSDDKLQIHHKNYNQSDSNLNNLICLCETCHFRLHGESHKSIQYLKNEIEFLKPPTPQKSKKMDLKDLEWKDNHWYNKRLKTYLT